MTSVSSSTGVACGRCGRSLRKALYEVGTDDGRAARCLRCTLRHRPLVRRSLVVALIVGTILTAINQGNILLRGDFPAELLWKVPLTYMVPYCVATTGAILNARSRAGP